METNLLEGRPWGIQTDEKAYMNDRVFQVMQGLPWRRWMLIPTIDLSAPT